MTLQLTTALAPSFSWAATAGDVTLTFASGASPVTAALSTGTYRMMLAPATGPGTLDLVRVLASKIDAACVAAGRAAPGATCTLGATGLLTLTVPGAASITIGTRLGLYTGLASVSAATTTATRQPWFLALFIGTTGEHPQPLVVGGGETTLDGRTFGFATTQPAYRVARTATLIPRDPTFRTALGWPQSPLLPDAAARHSLADVVTSRVWSVLDVLRATISTAPVDCGWTEDLAGVRAGTTLTCDLVYVDAAAALAPQPETPDKSWHAHASLRLPLLYPSSGSTVTL